MTCHVDCFSVSAFVLAVGRVGSLGVLSNFVSSRSCQLIATTMAARVKPVSKRQKPAFKNAKRLVKTKTIPAMY